MSAALNMRVYGSIVVLASWNRRATVRARGWRRVIPDRRSVSPLLRKVARSSALSRTPVSRSASGNAFAGHSRKRSRAEGFLEIAWMDMDGLPEREVVVGGMVLPYFARLSAELRSFAPATTSARRNPGGHAQRSAACRHERRRRAFVPMSTIKAATGRSTAARTGGAGPRRGSPVGVGRRRQDRRGRRRPAHRVTARGTRWRLL